MAKLLDERLIILDADISSSEEAARLMGARLEELGYVEAGYADMVIEREKTFPTGLPGKTMAIALPHTNPTLVNKPAIGVIVPRDSVKYKMMGGPETALDVKLIVPLIIKDPNNQLSLLKAMMGVIQDGELLERIRNSRDKQEILDCLQVIEDAVQE